MIDRFFTLALALGLMVLGVSTAIGITRGAPTPNPRMVEFDRVLVHAPRTMFVGGTAPEVTYQR